MSEGPPFPEGWRVERMHEHACFGVRVTRRLHTERTPFQEIEVWDSPHHGRVLLLDGCFMATELDEFVYHEMLAHPGAQTLEAPRRALVVGGGDGGAVGELLKYPGLEVELVEIDERVVRVSEEFFPAVSAGLTDPRVTLTFRDGLARLDEVAAGSLDLLLVDSTDPVGPAEGLITEGFYARVARALGDDGVLVAQTQTPFHHADDIRRIYANLARVFRGVWCYWAVCPSYVGALWTFCYASQSRDPLRDFAGADDLHARLGTRYYSAGVHRGAFALPPFVQELLPG